MMALDFEVAEERSDAVGSVGIAGEQDVFGQLSRRKIDVVLALSVRKGDAGIRARQGMSSYAGTRPARVVRQP
jgi:hypothetical protein